jgi:hypothetical protein
MKQYLTRRLARLVGLGAGMSVLGMGALAGPAMAVPTSGQNSSLSTSTSTSACSAPTLTQPFLSIGDSNLYALAPGESPDNLTGTGWTLSGGAKIVRTTLADGSTGSVLDLPSGATAISPQMCVTNDYPTARTLVRDVAGSEGVQVGVSYAGGAEQTVGHVQGQKTAWTTSAPFNVNPGSQAGWQLAQFIFVGNGKNGEFQLYDFYVDPRAMW